MKKIVKQNLKSGYESVFYLAMALAESDEEQINRLNASSSSHAYYMDDVKALRLWRESLAVQRKSEQAYYLRNSDTSKEF